MRTRYTIHILNHNYNPEPILESLLSQLTPHSENIHITLWDDCSDPEYRNMLSESQSRFDRSFVIWNIGQKNIGRTGMRQKLLKSTLDGWMIFIDSDMIPDPDFIDHMKSSLQDKDTVYTGCHYYQDNQPATPYKLHWNYGRLREVPAQSKNTYSHFSTGIFAVHSSLAADLHFESAIKTYGHEDTLFGLLLQKKNIPLRPSSMNALHMGLSNTDEFITKQLESVQNLQVVLSRYPEYESSLIKWARRANRIPVVRNWLRRNQIKIFCFKKLARNPKQLFYLDLLKINQRLSDSEF